MAVIGKCCHSKNKVLSFRPKGGNLLLLCHSHRREESAVALSFRPKGGICCPLSSRLQKSITKFGLSFRPEGGIRCCFVIPTEGRDLLLAENNPLLGLATDALANQIGEAAFRSLAKLVVMRSFLADDKPSAAIAGVKPFRARCCRSVAAVKTYAGPHLDKRSALRQFRRSLVLDPHQRSSLVAFQHPHRADRDRIPGFSLSDSAPLSRSQQKADHKHRSRHDGGEDEEGFFQRSNDPKLRQAQYFGA